MDVTKKDYKMFSRAMRTTIIYPHQHLSNAEFVSKCINSILDEQTRLAAMVISSMAIRNGRLFHLVKTGQFHSPEKIKIVPRRKLPLP